jgi:hypothetical protein
VALTVSTGSATAPPDVGKRRDRHDASGAARLAVTLYYLLGSVHALGYRPACAVSFSFYYRLIEAGSAL